MPEPTAINWWYAAAVLPDLPARSALPDGAENLVVAGTATALTLQAGVTVQNVDVQQLRAQLWSDGLLDPDTIPFP